MKTQISGRFGFWIRLRSAPDLVVLFSLSAPPTPLTPQPLLVPPSPVFQPLLRMES